MLLDKLSRKLVVIIQELTPALITYLRGAARRVDDVGKQDRRQDALKIG